MAFTDFSAGLQNANDYLSARHHLSGTTALGSDAFRIVAQAQYSFSLKEILCSVLSGNGFKLPNIQICLFANISALLGLPNLQAALYGALSKLAGAFRKFMDHTKIDDILGRLNSILSEAQQVANLINFCSQPADPIAIPNLIERAFGSFLGAGMAIADAVGSMAPNQVCACLGTGGFNTNIFTGGILGQISANFSAIAAGLAPRNLINAISSQVNAVVSSITSLIDFENNIFGSYSQGGSSFGIPDSGCNRQIGVMHNPSTGGIAGNARLASSLKSLYDKLAGYPVQYVYNKNPATGGPLLETLPAIGSGGISTLPGNITVIDTETGLGAGTDPVTGLPIGIDPVTGSPISDQYVIIDSSTGLPITSITPNLGEVVEYPNIFHLLVEPEILDILNREDEPSVDISNQIPVYDYCGNIIGYTTNYVQKAPEESNGNAPQVPDSPGFNAGNLTTNESNIIPDTPIIAEPLTINSTGANTVIFPELNTINCALGDYFSKDVSSDTVFVFENAPTEKDKMFTFTLHILHTSGTISWPSTVRWPGGTTPVLNTGSYHLFRFTTFTNGTVWLGEPAINYPYAG